MTSSSSPSTPGEQRQRIEELTEALRLTVEYVGLDTLPAISGWSWYDALKDEPWFAGWIVQADIDPALLAEHEVPGPHAVEPDATPPTPASGEGTRQRPLPEFQMVACAEHLLAGHRWRCRACRREVERQFRECCEEMWRLQRAASPAPPAPLTRPDLAEKWRAEADGQLVTHTLGAVAQAQTLRRCADELDTLPAPLTPTPQPSEEATDA